MNAEVVAPATLRAMPRDSETSVPVMRVNAPTVNPFVTRPLLTLSALCVVGMSAMRGGSVGAAGGGGEDRSLL